MEEISLYLGHIQSESVQSHAKTTLGVNVKIQSDIAVAIANAVASFGVNGPLRSMNGSSTLSNCSLIANPIIKVNKNAFQ